MPTIGVCVILLATACGPSRPGPSRVASAGGVRVVASTDVYGDIVRQIAGGRVRVTSVIDSSGDDPHSYEASTQDELALSKADIVVLNGGGYDDFMTSMLNASGNTSVTVVDVVKLSGVTTPVGGELNEHVWYDFSRMRKLATRLVSVLSRAAPASARVFEANAERFDAGLARLEAEVAKIRASHGGTGVAITEPVPLYLLEAMGLVNKTPPAFSEAIEDGTGVPVAVLKKTTDLFANGDVGLLVENSQTSGPETAQVVRAARSAGVPVVGVTETLPTGSDYLTWMRSNVDAIAEALG